MAPSKSWAELLALTALAAEVEHATIPDVAVPSRAAFLTELQAWLDQERRALDAARWRQRTHAQGRRKLRP